MFLLLKILFFLVVLTLNIFADNLALLSGTLKTYQKAGCDNDIVVLKCPAGTNILIQVAQYGKSAPSNGLCGRREVDDGTAGSCLWPKALQYSLLQTVVEACQKKRQCKIDTSPETFGGDPCPGMQKYVEIAYKCRPYEFRSKTACENEILQLKCNPHSRVAVYSASYGRTEYESYQCPQPQGVAEETCLVSYAMETVMQICHGKRSCELSADASTFGNPCRPESRMYLKVVYTCVPRKILKEQYEGRLEPDELETENDNEDPEFDNYDDGKEFIRESAASPPAPSIVGSPKGDNLTNDLAATSSKLPPQFKAKEREPENQERFYLYLIISVGGGVVLCLTILVVRLLLQRRNAKQEPKFQQTDITDNSLPNGFTDDISEVDADIDLTPSLPPTHVLSPHTALPLGSIAEVVRYPQVHNHTLRKPSIEMDVPRSLSGSANSHYYYG
ncbi:protein eva-1 homolog C isoform X4 [Onthophagus taurus]|uniref:protein eva-1 homolog C isoform X4 n=1 Tax=Onthophagus taurus TaxID=166361 RepID=UPI000C20A396|nr:protein eva-1 homolog C isoform X4 [Onthophagus taurus]